QTAVSASWPQQMRAMATDLQALLPYVYSRREFHDSENRKKVSSIIDRFSRSVDTVPKHVGEAMLGQDPIVRFSLNRLSANTEHAKRAFSEGHLEFARGLLKENVGLCFQCLTTTQFGPQNNFT